MTPRVSVLLPTHNRADVLGVSIASILAQSFADFELLVVGDGCTDGTADLVRGLADPRVRYFDFPKAPGFGYANRNRALAEARGDLIAFAAHDDLMFADHLDRLVPCFDSLTIAWAYSRPLWVSTDGIVVPFAVNLTLEDEFAHFLATRNTIPLTCVIARRETIVRAGGFPEDVPAGGDWRLHVAILSSHGRDAIAYLPEPTSLHFSANWKRARDSGFDEVAEMIRFAESTSWWPDTLRLRVDGGEPEQAVFWRAMQADPGGWPAAARAGVRTVLDRIAWDTICTLRSDRARDERMVELETHVDQSTRVVETMTSSLSWRLTSPLRGARRWFARSR
jgi:glycosyltransferase involved in cell wall biosynthesis